MMRILVALTLVFGLIAADPIARISSSLDDLESIVQDFEDDSDERAARLIPNTVSTVFKLIYALIGDKLTAISLAVSAIKWLVSNSLVIVIGAAAAVGFCKLTGKCTLKYDELIPVSQLRSIVTPEHIETAEKFLVSAVKRYAQDEKRDSTSPSIESQVKL